jgi:cell division protein FtsL
MQHVELGNKINFAFMKVIEYFQKIQKLSLIKRKIIFWAIIIIFGLILFAGYILNVKHKIENFPIQKSLEELKVPQLKEEIKELSNPKIEKPVEEIKGDVEEIKKLLEEAEKQQGQK